MSKDYNPEDIEMDMHLSDESLARALTRWARPLFPAKDGARYHAEFYHETQDTLRVGLALDGSGLTGESTEIHGLYNLLRARGYRAGEESPLSVTQFAHCIGSRGGVVRFVKSESASPVAA